MPAKKAARKTASSKLKVKVKDLKAKKDIKAGGLCNIVRCGSGAANRISNRNS